MPRSGISCGQRPYFMPTEGRYFIKTPCPEGGFHLPKGDFTPAKGRDFTKKAHSHPKAAMRSLYIQTIHV